MIGVTSFSRKGFDAYGKHFLESMHHFPGRIICYLESPIPFEHENLEKRSFFEIPGVLNFLTNIRNLPKADGIVNGRYDYNFDLNKFCRKMFCQFDAFKEGGKIFWLDADIKFTSPMSEDFLNGLFEGNPLVYFGRPGFYTETGFVGFDTDHEEFPAFAERYQDTLRKGQVFKLPRWHDCQCFDFAKGDLGRSLSPKWRKGDNLHVMEKSVLKKYLTHYKGPKKKELH